VFFSRILRDPHAHVVRVDAESHQLKAIAVHMAEARRALETFLRETEAARIAEDLPAWESRAENSEQITDHYLAALTHSNGCKLATLDGGIKHPAVQWVEPAEAGRRWSYGGCRMVDFWRATGLHRRATTAARACVHGCAELAFGHAYLGVRD
jgi:hypothetical protein